MCKFSIHLCRQKKKEKSFISLLVKRKNAINQTSISIVHYYRLLRPLWNTDGLMVPVNWLALTGAIYSRITPYFALNRIFFPANEEATLKTKQPIRFQGFFKVTWINLISNRLPTALIKYLNWPSPVFGRFQNGCNKVVIEPRVVQFWSEILLVISNRTRAAHLFDFEIRRMISAQIALHSVQLPL